MWALNVEQISTLKLAELTSMIFCCFTVGWTKGNGMGSQKHGKSYNNNNN